jgi:hypothetical protein
MTTAQKVGAAEIVINAQFSPGVETADDIVAQMERSLAGNKASLTVLEW